eukprot:5166771-Alexandrium_andersonii.AAC.1
MSRSVNGLNLQPWLGPLDDQARADWISFRQGATRDRGPARIEPLEARHYNAAAPQVIGPNGLASHPRRGR